MHDIEFLIALLAVVGLLSQLARLVGVPYPIFLVLGGLGLGFVPGLPRIELPPDVIFLVFLPPLVFSAAFLASPRELLAHARPIGLLAVVLVLLTTLAVAAVAHFASGLPWAAAFVLGAVVSPTDPVAAEATYRRLNAPERVSTVISGESVINDGTALVVYKITVGVAAGGAFSLWRGGLDFVLLSVGGALLGLALGRIVSPIYERLKDPAILVAFTLIAAYFSYILAEEVFGVSGILAVAALGLYVGWQVPKRFTAQTRLQGYSFWETLTFLLDSFLFVLIGIQFPIILESLGVQSIARLILYAALVCGCVVGLRLLWFFTVPYADPLLDRVLGSVYRPGSWRERLVMAWSGVRGAIPLAAALSIPLSVGGAPFPGRDLILFLTVCVIFVTLVIQGLSLPFLITRLGVKDEGHEDRMEELAARLSATRAALKRLENLEGERFPEPVRERLREVYEERLGRYESGLEAGQITEEYEESSAAWRRFRRELFDVEREAVVALRDKGEIGSGTMRRVERDIDLEELRFGG